MFKNKKAQEAVGGVIIAFTFIILLGVILAAFNPTISLYKDEIITNEDAGVLVRIFAFILQPFIWMMYLVGSLFFLKNVGEAI